MLTIPKNKKAFLFDMDGTLVDTEPIGPEVFNTLFSDNGITPTPDERSLFIKAWRRDGVTFTTDEYLTQLIAKYDITQAPSGFISEFYTRYKQAIVTSEELTGVGVFLNMAKSAGIILAVISSSKRDQIEAVLDNHEWGDLFSLIVGEEDIRKFKPDPEPYLVAMQKLSLNPANCVVFEDATNGAISGKKAGMFVIGLREGNEIEQDLSAADIVVQSFAELNFNS